MKCKLLPIAAFDDLAAEWDGVVNATNAPFLYSTFVRPLLRQFSKGNEIIVAGYEGRELQVGAILKQSHAGLWQTFQPSQLPLGAIVARRGSDIRHIAESLLAATPGPSVSLGLTQIDPLIFARPPDQPRLQTLDYVETAWVDVSGTFASYWESRGKNLRHNIRKQRSKLDEQGIALRLETLTRPQDVVSVLHDYGALESVGWKAAGGTAIHPDNAQGRFYREMLEAFCASSHGRLYRLWFDDRVVAVDLCITSEDTLVILKTTYDETQQGYSPAFLLRHAAFNELYNESRIRRIEFYGKLMDWHKRWTDHSRTLYHVNHYRWAWLPRVKRAFAGLRKRDRAPSTQSSA
jgi:hypothetical protein